MQGRSGFVRAIAPNARQRIVGLSRFGLAVIITLSIGSALAAGARADTRDAEVQNTGASNGGTASATSGGNISIGQIVTGENMGNSINTGNIAGSAELNGGEIDYPTDVNVTQNIGPLVATADGGDGGQASGPSQEPPELNVNIRNRSNNNNRSDATGIGEGGEGGAGGAGGNATINGAPAP